MKKKIGNSAENQNEEQDDNNNEEERISPHFSHLGAKHDARSVQSFQKRLETKGIKGSKDGFLIVNKKKN